MQKTSKKSKNACWYAEALCLGVTIGFSEVLLAIYYGSQEMDSVTLAIFMTVPAAFGALAQAGMTNIRRICANAKRLALSAMAIQISGLLLMAWSLTNLTSHSLSMFIGQCLYWIGGMTSSSPTQEILAHNVDPSLHNRFFSRRAMLMTVLTLICNLSSARVLDHGLTNTIMATFLLIAALMRFVSLLLVFISANHKPAATQHTDNRADDGAVVSIIKLSLVMMLFRCAVNLSSPFYSTYMLREIDLGFTVYSFLTALPLLTKALCLTNWARLLDDNRKFEGLAIATFAIGTVPVLWAINASTPWLGFLQVLSGLSWAGFDLISILLVQNMYPRSITQKLGIYLALSSIGSVAGGIIGGFILRQTASYHTLFAFSGILRLFTGFGLLWYLRRHHLFRFKELRVKSGIATLITVRPSIEAAAKILPINLRKDSRQNHAA
jgi:hypothetical protein